jgi:hypothetical protein
MRAAAITSQGPEFQRFLYAPISNDHEGNGIERALSAGVGAGASGAEKDASMAGGYYKDMAAFTIYKVGLMYNASLEGEKFSLRPVGL